MKQILAFLVFISFLACGQKKKSVDKSISSTEIAKQVSAITKDKKGIVSVSIKGIDFPFEYNNENATKKLPMLSVFKFHIGMTVLDLVDQGKLDLNQKIFVKKSELHENTWSPLRKEFPEGNKEFTLAELLQYMVCQSDNNVTDILIRLVGGTEKIQQFINKKGGKDFTIKNDEEQMHQKDWKSLYENSTTTKSLNQLLIDFYNGKILSKKSTAYMYNLMLQTTTGANKLSAQLPKGSIAHRTGSSGKVGDLTIAENDIGIVTLPNGKHYAITVFVSDSTESEETNTKMISEISKVVWDFFNK
jgi:beta-lactamase class A